MDLMDKEIRGIELDKMKTELKKEQFISKVRGGLVDEIKKNGSKITRIKKSRFRRFLNTLKRLF